MFVNFLLKPLPVICLLLILSGCTSENQDNTLPDILNRKNRTSLRIGLVLSSYGLGDESFNDMQYNGLIEAYRKFNIDVEFSIASNESVKAYHRVFSYLLDTKKCDAVFAFHGFKMSETVNKIAPKYPDRQFIVINYPFKLRSNVFVCSFATDEGSFLCGYLAAAFSKTGKIGMLIGVNIPALAVFRNGFTAGAAYYSPATVTDIRYCSKVPDFSGFESPRKGYKTAVDMYKNRVDVIYAAAGSTGNGIIQAAKDTGNYVIGVDTDQDKLAPGHVLTSMMKRFDRVVYHMIERLLNKKLNNKNRFVFNLANGGITLTPMRYTEKVIPDKLKTELQKIKQKIINGQLRINR